MRYCSVAEDVCSSDLHSTHWEYHLPQLLTLALAPCLTRSKAASTSYRKYNSCWWACYNFKDLTHSSFNLFRQLRTGFCKSCLSLAKSKEVRVDGPDLDPNRPIRPIRPIRTTAATYSTIAKE